MINIKTAATIVAGVTVAASSIHQMIVHARKDAKTPVEEAVEAFYSPEFIAFNKAQTIVSDRMLAGYYDDKTDAEYQADFNVVYANFLTK